MVVAVALVPSALVEKYTFTDADAGDLPVNERSDDGEEEEIGCAPQQIFL